MLHRVEVPEQCTCRESEFMGQCGRCKPLGSHLVDEFQCGVGDVFLPRCKLSVAHEVTLSKLLPLSIHYVSKFLHTDNTVFIMCFFGRIGRI